MQTALVTRGRRQPLHTGLAERLRHAYNVSPLTQRQIGEISGLSHTILSAIGQNTPTLDTVERLAHALGVPSCWLCYGTHGDRPFQQRLGAEVPMQPGPSGTPTEPLASQGLGPRLLAARTARRLSRLALARVAGVSHTTIGNLEAGKTTPRADLCESLALALEVSPCWLAYGVGQGLPDANG